MGVRIQFFKLNEGTTESNRTLMPAGTIQWEASRALESFAWLPVRCQKDCHLGDEERSMDFFLEISGKTSDARMGGERVIGHRVNESCGACLMKDRPSLGYWLIFLFISLQMWPPSGADDTLPCEGELNATLRGRALTGIRLRIVTGRGS